jgi:GNAT superfamily N-acetyltransferase
MMVIDLDETPPAPAWPAGFVLRTYGDRPDLPAVYRAVDEAFRDHWGYVARDEAEALRRWQSRLERDKDFDPSLWFLVTAGEEIAAVALCATALGEDREMGWVNQLGVRRPWRRQGLALQLLYHVFAEFRRRGRKRVGLGVDAQSLTGATRLYEKAGMRVARETLDCEKELRAGRDVSTQSL